MTAVVTYGRDGNAGISTLQYYKDTYIAEFSEKTPPSQNKAPGGVFLVFSAKTNAPGVFLQYKSQSRDTLNLLKIRLKMQSRASHLKITLFELPEMVYLDVLYPNI